jgi:hypothetical protein
LVEVVDVVEEVAGTAPAAEPNWPETARVSRERENRGAERGH